MLWLTYFTSLKISLLNIKWILQCKHILTTGKEAIRIASAQGAKALQKLNARKVYVESFGHAESAAEGSALGVWLYQEKKMKKYQIFIPQLELYDDCDWTGWQIGLQKAAAQNLARQLMDTPANLMTPTSFAQNAVEASFIKKIIQIQSFINYLYNLVSLFLKVILLRCSWFLSFLQIYSFQNTLSFPFFSRCFNASWTFYLFLRYLVALMAFAQFFF